MRRYTLTISNREFVVDVQEIDADNFEVVVGGETYQVNLTNEENLAGATITPGFAPNLAAGASPARKSAAARPAPAASTGTAAPSPTVRKPAGGGKGTQTAPMPGVILEVNVKPGDVVTRGQQVAVLDAMKMHNAIRAVQAGTVDAVYVEAGQTVDHGTPILKYREE